MKARKRIRRGKNERGVALLMVMAAFAILTVLATELRQESNTELASAVADRDATIAEYEARSALNLARLLIATEPTIRQTIAPIYMMMKKTPPQLPIWEFSDRLLGFFTSTDSAKDFGSSTGIDFSQAKNLGFPKGHFELTIVDEDAKINANLGGSNEFNHIRLARELQGAMASPQFNPLFEKNDKNNNVHDRLSVCAAIIDWADSDESGFNCDVNQGSGSRGVEDAFYQLLQTPYRRKNAPFDSLEELRMVRGVTDDFWATMVDPVPEKPAKRVFTVWGQGAINVNTANAQTLLAIVCAGQPKAEVCTDIVQGGAFLTGMTMARGLTMGAPVFGNAKDFIAMLKGKGQFGPLLAMIGMKPITLLSESEFAKTITTESKVFSVYAVGIVPGYKRESHTSIHAVVDFRNAPTVADMQKALTPSSVPGQIPPAAKPASTTNTPVSADAIAAAISPSTGGTIVYYRQE